LKISNWFSYFTIVSLLAACSQEELAPKIPETTVQALSATVVLQEDGVYSGKLPIEITENLDFKLSVITPPTKGVLTIEDEGKGLIKFAATPNATGDDFFTYQISSGEKESEGKISLVITPVNDAPEAVNGTLSIVEDVPGTGVLSARDIEGETLTYIVVANGGLGTATITNAATGAYTYTPNSNANGTDSFTFKASDGTDDSNTATVVISIVPVNDAPVAFNGSRTLAEDSTAEIFQLAASDPDGQSLSAGFQIVDQPTKGTVVLGTGGQVAYVPTKDLNGSDSFTFKVTDGSLFSNVATFSLTITPSNDAPVALNRHLTAIEDAVSAAQIIAWGVLSGFDSDAGSAPTWDIDSSSFTVSIVANGAKGTAVVTNSATGALTYTPNANATGTDSFTYKIYDGSLYSNVATVNVSITPVNDRPVAANGSLSVTEDIAASSTLSASDVDDATLTYSIASQGTKGTVAITNATRGEYTYTPIANISGTDSFTFKASDGTLDATATISVTIAAVNDAPVAGNISVSGTEDTPYFNTLTNLATGPIDIDSNSLTFSIVGVASHGTVTISNSANGAFTYAPQANYSGADSFTYRIYDGSLYSNTATVSISIAEVNDAPVLAAITVSLGNTYKYMGKVVATDVEGNTPITYQIVSAPTLGAATLNSNTGVFTYIRNGKAAGSDSFTVMPTDSLGASPVSASSITISMNAGYECLAGDFAGGRAAFIHDVKAVKEVDYLRDIIVKADGSFMMFGVSPSIWQLDRSGTSASLVSQKIAVARFLCNGVLDETYGVGGYSGYTDNEPIESPVAVTAFGNGWLMAVDNYSTSSGNKSIVLFDEQGNVDTSFVASRPQYFNTISRLATYPGNKVLTLAFSRIERRLRSGALDATFGSGGNVTVNDNNGTTSVLNSILPQPDGKILVAGSTYVIDWQNRHAKMLVSRLLASGEKDSSFGTQGVVVVDATQNYSSIQALALQKDGKIVGAGLGTPGWNPNTPKRVTVLRLDANGTPDASFGTNGVFVANLPVAYQSLSVANVSVLWDEKILVGFGGWGAGLSALRLLPNGSLDTTFNGVGYHIGGQYQVTPGATPLITFDALSMFVRPDGRILLGGSGRTDSFLRNGVSFQNQDWGAYQLRENGVADDQP